MFTKIHMEVTDLKIGEFAQKYDLKQSAIRYYIDKALLSPERRNGQYIFGQTCMEQMEKLLYYKSLGFSLDETGNIVCYEDASNLKDKGVITRLLGMMEEKQKEIQANMEKEEQVLQGLQREIQKYESLLQAPEEPEQYPGMPLEVLGLLVCPDCGDKPQLQNAVIADTDIQSARIQCGCGYQAEIRNGVLIGEGSAKELPFQPFENIDSVSAITDDFSASYLNLMDRSHLRMFQSVSLYKEAIRYMMVGPFTYNFILKYIKQMPKDIIYVVTDVSIDKIRKLQQYFSELERRIIYIVGDSSRLPLRSGFADCYIDDFSTSNYIFAYNQDLMERIGSLIRPGGRIVGVFVDYNDATKSLLNVKKENALFDPEQINSRKLYQNILRAGFQIEEKNAMGSPAANEKAFRQQAENETIILVVYVAEKEQ